MLLWSPAPWRDVDEVGDPALPGGRFVAGTTDAPGGEVRVVGVCVPWRDAHVRTGRRDRAPWEDHLAYLGALVPHARRWIREHPRLVLAGDLNQAIPRHRQPVRVADALSDVLAGYALPTAGRDCEGRRLIDHVAHGPGLSATAVRVLSRQDGEVRLSDHDCVVVDLAAPRA